MDIRTFLLDRLSAEAAHFWGEKDAAYLGRVADDWLDTTGRSGSSYRIDHLVSQLPDVRKILDMGAGCGTFVYYALSRGYDAWGIEPEDWKREVVRRREVPSGYDTSWVQRIVAGAGERIPFADDTFDAVSTFQTLEHVQDLEACCGEMLRVTRPGGGIHIRCPDYALSTYEGHYRLPWLPGLWGKAAERYLMVNGKPVEGLRSLQRVSARKLRGIFSGLAGTSGTDIRITDLTYHRVLTLLRLRDSTLAYLASRPVVFIHFVRLLFRADYAVHLFVAIEKKRSTRQGSC
jgi:SAM-dependent methyltransferase